MASNTDRRKISGMVNALPLKGTELVEILQDGENRHLPVKDLVGPKGNDGVSAYRLAVLKGFEGSMAQWLESLKGEPGPKGLSAFEVAQEYENFGGTVEQWLESLRGPQGKSAYDVAVEMGLVETPEEWINLLRAEEAEVGIDLLQDGEVVAPAVTQLQLGEGLRVTKDIETGKTTVSLDSSGQNLSGKPVRRQVTLTHNSVKAQVNIMALGSQEDVNAIEITQDAGNLIALGNVAEGCLLQSVSIAYEDGYNTDTQFILEYPEPYGETDVMIMNIPVFFQYSHSNPPVMQPPLQQNYQNNDGIVRLTKVGLVEGRGYHWKHLLY